MYRTTRTIMIAMAAVAIATGVASAQALKADIPFAFRVGNDLYAPGSYRVELQSAGTRIFVQTAEKGHGTVILTQSSVNVPKQWRESGAPTLAFECGLGRCQLTQVWSGDELPAFNVSHPRASHDESATLRLIHLARTNAD